MYSVRETNTYEGFKLETEISIAKKMIKNVVSSVIGPGSSHSFFKRPSGG